MTYAPFADVADTPDHAASLPGAAYADPAVFQAEVERVFRAGWLPVARTSDLANAGDYRSVDLFGVPLIVTRDRAGQTHVLSRVCRHRGMILAEGSGNTHSLTCPYHLWRYGLDGRLASAPAMEQSASFDRNLCDLPRLASEQWGGWVFVNLGGDAAPLAPRLAGLTERLAPAAPEALVTAATLSFDSPWNWKVMVENFLESYHHIGPHAGTLQKTNPGLGTYEGLGGELFTVLENPAGEDHSPFVVAAVFPATLMFFSGGPDPVGAWYELDQVSHQRFTLRIHLLTSPAFAAIPEAVAALSAQVTAIHLEDIPVCEGVQKGVTSPLYQPGPLSHLEATLWRFHAFLQRAMG